MRGAFWQVLGEHTPPDHPLTMAEIRTLIEQGSSYVGEYYLPNGEHPGERECFALVEDVADHVDRCRYWLAAGSPGIDRAEAYLDRTLRLVASLGVAV